MHLIPLFPHLVGKSLLFLVWLHLMTQQNLNHVAVKPGNSSVVIGYDIDECTHLWLMEISAAYSHIYLGFKCKVSNVTDFGLSWVMRIYRPSC